MARSFARGALLLGVLLGSSASEAAARTDQVLIHGNVAGAQTVSESAATGRADYSYTDRGRGEHLVASWTLDAAGLPVDYQCDGNDYHKVAISERFTLRAGQARWSSRAEHGSRAAAGAFYVPANPPPEFLAVLARALLKAREQRLPLLPAGAASLEPVPGSADQGGARLYLVHGLDFDPTPVWLNPDGSTFASVSDWLSVLSPPAQPLLSGLRSSQDAARDAWAARLARTQTQVPAGDVVIRHARLFDPRDLSVTPGMSVLVRGERIVRIGPDAEVEAADAQVLDAGDRFLMPGLWDNHQHFADDTGALDLANGVTSARDMANDTDGFLRRVARMDAGSELGPRVWKSGVIDGKGPFAAPTRMLVDSAAEARADVAWYADHGYGQIKIYSSVPPQLVPVIADAAHARGLRVSGHVPAFMSARQFVAAGADEIQHLNFVLLNFLFDEVKETRNLNRFTAVAAHARELTPQRPDVQEFIGYLKRHHTVLDPTVNVFEGLFCGDPARIAPGLEAVAPRMPPQVRRGLLSGALAVPTGQEDAYRAALPAMLSLLRALHEAGVTLIPGTDSLAGYELHHELALYVEAGIPAPEVLRMATLTSAQVVGASERGVIAPGKLADLILVEGDPSVHIGDLDRVDVVMKGGRLYDAAQIEQALGIAPRAAAARGPT
jgi:cytosine/adenosine deaminase-related metal-dependent hydrolase